MKNNLFVFGCSYSAKFKHSGITTDYETYLNGWPLSWSEILSDKLNLELVNRAKGGRSNDSIFDDFCNESGNIKKGDIVIIGWSYLNRFRTCSTKSNSTRWIDVSVSNPEAIVKHTNLSTRTVEEICLSRIDDLYEIELHNREKLIVDYLKLKNVNLFLWNGGFPFKTQEHYLLEKFRENELETFDNFVDKHGGFTIAKETQGKISDNHLGKHGNIVQAELFYDEILKKI